MAGSGTTIGQVTEIGALLDPGSFDELDAARRPGETGGAVVGIGTVDGRDVATYTVDMAGLDEAGVTRVAKAQELALRSRIPIVGVHDASENEEPGDLPTLAAWTGVLRTQGRSSGVIPQLAVLRGPAGPRSLQSAALADLTFRLDEDAGWAEVRRVLSFLPANCGEAPPARAPADPAGDAPDELQGLILRDPALPLDLRWVAERLLDGGDLVEVDRCGASESVLVGFGRLIGHAVGLVANDSSAGALDAGACARAARFIRLCDAFALPVLTLVDAPGPLAASPADLSRLVYAYAEATVPTLTVVAGRTSADAYVAMAPRALGVDLVLGWPTATIATADVYAAAERGVIDSVIEPRETRPALLRALELCLRKRADAANRRHGNIPL
jgi:acetyl-CoA carboxylase carboxyltransferase component